MKKRILTLFLCAALLFGTLSLSSCYLLNSGSLSSMLNSNSNGNQGSQNTTINVSGGDDYDDPAYREAFRTLLTAVQEKRRVKMTYASQRGKTQEDECTPLRLEYSEKDDRFRVLCATAKGVFSLRFTAAARGGWSSPRRSGSCRVCLPTATMPCI